jgi:hypothetical protein
VKLSAQNSPATRRREEILKSPGLVAFWDFQDDPLRSLTPPYLTLTTGGTPPAPANEGVFGPTSLKFEAVGDLAKGFLFLPADGDHPLSLGGEAAELTVICWIKRETSAYKGCQFLAGVWNEHCRRQYGLFLNLKIWDSAEQVGAHVSQHGGPTPGYPYCMDAAIGATPVPFESWHCVAMTYDGKNAAAYLDGRLDVREPQGEPGRNPFHLPGGLNPEPAEFTVGAVSRPSRVEPDPAGGFRESGSLIANPFVGLLGGLAVFRRALSASELEDQRSSMRRKTGHARSA